MNNPKEIQNIKPQNPLNINNTSLSPKNEEIQLSQGSPRVPNNKIIEELVTQKATAQRECEVWKKKYEELQTEFNKAKEQFKKDKMFLNKAHQKELLILQSESENLNTKLEALTKVEEIDISGYTKEIGEKKIIDWVKLRDDLKQFLGIKQKAEVWKEQIKDGRFMLIFRRLSNFMFGGPTWKNILNTSMLLAGSIAAFLVALVFSREIVPPVADYLYHFTAMVLDRLVIVLGGALLISLVICAPCLGAMAEREDY